MSDLKTLPLTKEALREWAEQQPQEAVVGRPLDSQQCPCARCLLELRIITPGTRFSVFSTHTVATSAEGTAYYEHDPWLQALVSRIDRQRHGSIQARDLLHLLDELP